MNICPCSLMFFCNSPAQRAFHLSPHCSDLCDPGFLGSCEFPSFRFQMLKIDENWDLTTKNYQKLWFEHVLTVLRRVFISKIQLPCKQLVIPGDLRNILGFNSRLKISSRGFGQINKMSSHALERLERSTTCVQSFTKLFFPCGDVIPDFWIPLCK